MGYIGSDWEFMDKMIQSMSEENNKKRGCKMPEWGDVLFYEGKPEENGKYLVVYETIYRYPEPEKWEQKKVIAIEYNYEFLTFYTDPGWLSKDGGDPMFERDVVKEDGTLGTKREVILWAELPKVYKFME